LLELIGSGQQDAGGFAGVAGGFGYPLQRVAERRVIKLLRHPQADTQVKGTYEQNIDPFDRCDGFSLVHRFGGFDLDDGEDVVIGDRKVLIEIRAKAGGPGPPCHSPHALRREAHGGDGEFGFARVVHIGHHHARGAHVEDALEPRRLVPGNAHHGRGRCPGKRLELVQQLRFPAAAVLEVNQGPIQAGQSRHFRRKRRTQVEPRTHAELARQDFLPNELHVVSPFVLA